MSEGYADKEGYTALVAYDLLNLFALNYLTTQDSNIITGDKIISNGNCMFHALGYAYYASLTETPESDENYAVPKIWHAENSNDEPSYNINDDPLLTTKYYDDSNSISDLKTDDNKRDINVKALALKTRVAQTIINFNKYYNKINLANKMNVNIVSGDHVTYEQFIAPIDKNDQYYPADDNSIYASAFLLNKIICIINCQHDFDDENNISRQNIMNYQLVGSKNMFCTKTNILFLLYSPDYGHYETFYPENDGLNISVKQNIVEKFNELISTSKNKPDNNKDYRIVPAPEQFLNHLESYSFYSRDIDIDFKQKPTIDNATLKNKVTSTDSFETEFEQNKVKITSINTTETDQDKLYDNQALLNKLLTENQELNTLIHLSDISEEERNMYSARQIKITELIEMFVKKLPSRNPVPISIPLIIMPVPSNKLRTPTKYSFYSKERPALNLALTNPIPYTPYIFRVRTRKPLQLKILTE